MSIGQPYPGQHNGSLRAGQHDGSRRPGSHDGSARPGTTRGEGPLPGQHDGSQRPGTFDGSPRPGAVHPVLPKKPRLVNRPAGKFPVYDSKTGKNRPTSPEPFPVRLLLKENHVDGNLLICTRVDQGGVEREQIVVARLAELQRAFYDGKTVGGVAYVHVDNTSRTGDGDTEEIVPSYEDDETILLAVYLPGGTGLRDDKNQVVYWQEFGFRGWGVS